jgi:hypothetical protein
MPRQGRDVGSRFSTGGRTDLALPIGIESHRLVVFSGVTLNHPYRTFCGRLGGVVMSPLFGRLGAALTVFGGRISPAGGCLSGGRAATRPAVESPVVLVATTRAHGWTVLHTRSAPIRVWSMGKQGLAGPI